MRPEDVDWDRLFGVDGVRWLHTGGIFAALGEHTPDVVEAAVTAARRHGTVVSFDLNYRASLWKAFGGQARAVSVNRRLVEHVDVLIGNEEDFTAALGFEVAGVEVGLVDLDVAAFGTMIDAVVATFPRLSVVATTLRAVRSASRNDWGAVAWSDGRLYSATHRPDLEIFDRVGGGDSFASGLIYGLLEGFSVKVAVEYGAAHGALAMTTPGDTSMVTLAEVAHLVAGGGARVKRQHRVGRAARRPDSDGPDADVGRVVLELDEAELLEQETTTAPSSSPTMTASSWRSTPARASATIGGTSGSWRPPPPRCSTSQGGSTTRACRSWSATSLPPTPGSSAAIRTATGSRSTASRGSEPFAECLTGQPADRSSLDCPACSWWCVTARRSRTCRGCFWVGPIRR